MKAYSNTAYPKRGFTLLECVVTLVIAGFIGAVITATMAYGVRIYQGSCGEAGGGEDEAGKPRRSGK